MASPETFGYILVHAFKDS